jgi:hypothetical protein
VRTYKPASFFEQITFFFWRIGFNPSASGPIAVAAGLLSIISLVYTSGWAVRAFRTEPRRLPSPTAEAASIRSAVPAIMDALKRSDRNWPELQLALIESRLQGIRQRWEKFADQVRKMSDEDLKQAFDERYAALLEAIEGKRGLPQDIAKTAAALYEKRDWQSLQGFLTQTFNDAAQRVRIVMEPEWFDGVTHDPYVQQAIQIYKDLVESTMADAHALYEGVFSDALGPLDTYYPLIAREDRASAFATGLAEGYYLVTLLA